MADEEPDTIDAIIARLRAADRRSDEGPSTSDFKVVKDPDLRGHISEVRYILYLHIILSLVLLSDTPIFEQKKTY